MRFSFRLERRKLPSAILLSCLWQKVAQLLRANASVICARFVSLRQINRQTDTVLKQTDRMLRKQTGCSSSTSRLLEQVIDSTQEKVDLSRVHLFRPAAAAAPSRATRARGNRKAKQSKAKQRSSLFLLSTQADFHSALLKLCT